MFRMLQGVQKVRNQVVVDPRMLDWNLVDELVEVLEDLASLTTKMQKEVYMMGDFFRDLYMCREDLENRSPNPHVPEMLRLLNSRTNVLLSTVTYAAAIVCDPRFNMHNSIANSQQREDAIVSIYKFI